jgi:hypothetical protein
MLMRFGISGFFLILSLMNIAVPICAQNVSAIKTDSTIILFDKPLEFAAQEVVSIYPVIKKELEDSLAWDLNFRPTIVLIKTQEQFVQMAGHKSYVAYAVPKNQLIVIDYSRMNIRPFTLRITLKHELCHLLLHHHIQEVHLPKWLDEGVSQWMSDGIAEIITGRRESVLKWAALTGRFIRLDSLTNHFPRNERDLILAYEQSKNLVEYIITNHGRNGILNILEAMKDGIEADKAIHMSLLMSIDDLENNWQKDQRSWTTLFSYIVANIYTVIFICAALLTIALYIRTILRKKRLLEEEEDEFYSS